MPLSLERLQEQRQQYSDEIAGLLASIEENNRDFTADEIARSQELETLCGDLDAQITTLARCQAMTQAASEPTGRQTQAAAVPAAAGGDGAHTAPVARLSREQRTGGFDCFGDLAVAVMQAGLPGARPEHLDPRLARLQPTNYSGTDTPADGGYAVPPDFRTFIWEAIMGPTSLLGRTDIYPSSFQQATVPTDEGGPWATTGPQANWIGEGQQIPDSKINLKQMNNKLHKLGAFLPVTEELLQDSPMMEAYIRSKVPRVMRYRVDRAIVAGTGTGQPTGFVGHAATKTLTRTTSGTISFADLQNFLAGMSPENFGESIWLCNSDVIPVLMGISFQDETSSRFPVWLPNFQVEANVYGSLLGRPVVAHEAMPQLNSAGDLVLWWPSGYMSVVKAGGAAGLRQDVSISFYFDHDIQSFRFILRMGGMPWLAAEITRDPDTGGGTWGQTVELGAGI